MSSNLSSRDSSGRSISLVVISQKDQTEENSCEIDCKDSVLYTLPFPPHFFYKKKPEYDVDQEVNVPVLMDFE